MHKEVGLKRELSLLECISIGIGTMIGGTVFSTIGVVLMLLKVKILLIFSLILNTLIALVIGYNYSKLSLKFSKCGASYSYVSEVFPRNIPLRLFIGYSMLTAYSAACAFYALVFSYYLTRFINLPVDQSILVKLISSLVIIFILLINIMGVREVGYTEDLLTFFKLIVLMIVILYGMPCMNIPKVLSINNLSNESISSIISGVLLGSSITFLGFEGFETIASTAEEIKDKRNVKRGILITLIIVPVLYVLTTLILISTLYSRSIFLTYGDANGETLLSDVAEQFMGEFGDYLVSFCAMVATLSAINGSLYAVSRLVYAMSRDYIITQWLSKINSRGIPYRSVILVGLISILLILMDTAVEKLGELTSLAFLICFSIVSLTNFKARKITNSNTLISFLGVLSPLLILAYAIISTPLIIVQLVILTVLFIVIGYLVLYISNQFRL